MSISSLKADFPQLKILTDEELEAVIASGGGLLRALSRAHAKRLASPRKVGRPAGPVKFKPVIQRRGKTSDTPLSPRSTNIQLAELAKAYMDCVGCSGAEAAEATLLELTGLCTPENKRRLAKLIAELPGRAQDKRVVHGNKAISVSSDLSFAAMLNNFANKSK